ncbi:hypothetical protein ACWF95_41915 [Streptomyces vinaceus]
MRAVVIGDPRRRPSKITTWTDGRTGQPLDGRGASPCPAFRVIRLV